MKLAKRCKAPSKELIERLENLKDVLEQLKSTECYTGVNADTDIFGVTLRLRSDSGFATLKVPESVYRKYEDSLLNMAQESIAFYENESSILSDDVNKGVHSLW